MTRSYPNPFSSATTIEYDLTRPGNVELSVYNHLGQKVGSLVNGYQQAGSQKVMFDVTSLQPGVYYCKLKQETEVVTKKIVAVR